MSTEQKKTNRNQANHTENWKRTQEILRELAHVLLILLVYYVVTSVSLYLLNALVEYLVQANSEGGFVWIVQNADRIYATNNGVAMLIGVFCLRKIFLSEVCMDGQPVLIKQRRLAAGWFKEECRNVRKWWKGMVLIVALATVSSLFFNWIAELMQAAMYSQKYQEIAAVQYSVPFVLGLLLYGVISPLAEEMLFRGIVYTKCRRVIGVIPGIFMSALLFALLHGNIVQGVYAFVMGLMICGVYERYKSFLAPVLFHAVANMVVFCVTYF